MGKVVPKPAAAVALPTYLQQAPIEGVEALKTYVQPPRLKIVQKQSDDLLLAQFPPGNVILPALNNTLVAAPETSFVFTPVFFFAEWVTLNPISLRGTLPMIRERTSSPQHPIAIKARDPGRRAEKCPEAPDQQVRHTEVLNYLVMIDLPDPMLVLMSFQRAEHSTGSRLAAMIQMRKASIFACRFVAATAQRKNQKGSWWGYIIANPEQLWVTEERFNALRDLHTDLAKAHADDAIVVEYEDESIESETTEY